MAGVYPGWCWEGYTGWVAGRAIPVPLQDPPRYPYLVIFQGPEPTHGQMKAISEVFMRFLSQGSRIDLELT